jgi:uncharacterized membrane protein (DUF4010 family)
VRSFSLRLVSGSADTVAHRNYCVWVPAVATITISAILTLIMTYARHSGMPTISRIRTTIQGRSPWPERGRTDRDSVSGDVC